MYTFVRKLLDFLKINMSQDTTDIYQNGDEGRTIRIEDEAEILRYELMHASTRGSNAFNHYPWRALPRLNQDTRVFRNNLCESLDYQI